MLLLPVLGSSESDQSQWLCPAPDRFIVAQFTSGNSQFSKVAATKAENSLLSQAKPLLRLHQLLRSPGQVSGETVSDERAPVSSPEGEWKFYLPPIIVTDSNGKQFFEHRPLLAEHIRTCSKWPSDAFSEAHRFQSEVRSDWQSVKVQMVSFPEASSPLLYSLLR